MTDTTFKVGQEAMANGKKVTIDEIKGQWAKVTEKKKDGETFKIRAKQLGEIGKGLVKPDLSKYVRGKGTTPSGRSTNDVDDETAQMLREMDIDGVYELVAKKLWELNAIPYKTTDTKTTVKQVEDYLRQKYEHLNLGMQRMNLGNRLRAAMKKGTIAKK